VFSLAIGKNRRTFCVVNRGVTLFDYSAHSCRAGKHAHINQAELDQLRSDGSIRPVDEKSAPKVGEPQPDHIFEWLIAEKVLRFMRETPTSGNSSRLGWYLADEYREDRKQLSSVLVSGSGERKLWAEAMVSQMRDPRLRLPPTSSRRSG
jgi:hypothetical protein